MEHWGDCHKNHFTDSFAIPRLIFGFPPQNRLAKEGDADDEKTKDGIGDYRSDFIGDAAGQLRRKAGTDRPRNGGAGGMQADL